MSRWLMLKGLRMEDGGDKNELRMLKCCSDVKITRIQGVEGAGGQVPGRTQQVDKI